MSQLEPTREHLELLYRCVKGRFMDGQPNAIVMAIQGLQEMLEPQTNEWVTPESLRAEVEKYYADV